MTTPFERPIKQVNATHPSGRRRKVRAMKAQDEAAQRKYAWAMFVRQHQGSEREARAALVEAMKAGTVPVPPMAEGKTVEDVAPSIWSVHYWRASAPEDVSITAFRLAPREGRPKVQLSPELEKIFIEEVGSGRTVSPTALHRELAKAAERLGQSAPSRHVVRARVADLPHQFRSVARQGKAAAAADATVRSAVPAEVPHAVWTLDELDAPVWVRVWSFALKRLVATKVSVVIIVDNYSGVVVGYYIANALRRDALRGHDRWDVLAALAGAAFRDLAPDACVPYAGYLPRVLRLDRHGAHEEARRVLKDLGVEVPNLPGSMPWARGTVEATVALLKAGCARFLGHEDAYEVAEYQDASNHEAQRIAAGTMARVTSKLPICIDQLWNLEQFAAAFDGVVAEVNCERVHSEWKMPRAARYAEGFQATLARPGTDAIALLEPTSIKVKKDGIVVDHVAFAPANPAVLYQVGEQLTVRVDPGLRSVFVVEKDGSLELCRPKREVAATTDAVLFAKAQRASAAVADTIAQAMRRRYREQAIGPNEAELADAVAKQKLDLQTAVTRVHQAERARSPRPGAKSKSARAVLAPAPVSAPGVTSIQAAPSFGQPAPAAPPRRGIFRFGPSSSSR